MKTLSKFILDELKNEREYKDQIQLKEDVESFLMVL